MTYSSGWGFASDTPDLYNPDENIEYVIKLELNLNDLRLYTAHAIANLTGDYDSISLRLIKGSLSRHYAEKLLFYENEENPRVLHIFSKNALPTATMISTLTKLELTIESMSVSSLLQLDPAIVGKCLINCIFQQMLLNEEWSAFATDTQLEGVLLHTTTNLDSTHDVVTLVNIVVNESNYAYLTLFAARYRLVPYTTDIARQTLRPMNREVQVIGPSLIHLSSLALNNRQQGYQLFLPDTDVLSIEYYFSLFGTSISNKRNPVELVEILDEGLRVVVPVALLCGSCIELSLQSKKLGPSIAHTFAKCILSAVDKFGFILSAALLENKDDKRNERDESSSATIANISSGLFISASKLKRLDLNKHEKEELINTDDTHDSDDFGDALFNEPTPCITIKSALISNSVTRMPEAIVKKVFKGREDAAEKSSRLKKQKKL